MLFCSHAHIASAQEPAFTATLDRQTITMGESANLVLSLTGGQPRTVPNVPPVPGLTIGYVGAGQQITILNGRRSVMVTHTFQLAPSQPGEYQLAPIRIEVDGKILTAQPPPLKVVRPGDPAAQADDLRQYAFLRLIVPKTEVYVGEVFLLEIQLYANQAYVRRQNVNTPQLRSDALTFNRIAPDGPGQARIGSHAYSVLSFKMSATAVRTGEIEVGPAEGRIVLTLPPTNPDPFDIFGQRYVSREVTLQSESHQMRVLPLPPEGMPADFSGAVGAFSSLDVSASPTNLAVGDPITIAMRVTGRGGLDALTIPGLEQWREFKVYPPSANVESSDPLGLQGSKAFEQVVVPENAEIKQLPSVSFSFFDPDQKQYRTLRSAPIPLAIRATTTAPAQPTIYTAPGSTPEKPPAQDIVHIKPHLGAISATTAPLVQQPWFWAIQCVPVALLFASIGWRKRQELLANNPRLRRRLKVRREAEASLQALHRLARENQAEEFFATLFRLLQEVIGARLDLPASAITEDAVEERLRAQGIDEALRGQLHELFQLCNQARYARHQTSAELESLLPKVAGTVRQLQTDGVAAA